MTNEDLNALRIIWGIIVLIVNGGVIIDLFSKLDYHLDVRNYIEMIIFIIEFIILTWLCWFNN